MHCLLQLTVIKIHNLYRPIQCRLNQDFNLIPRCHNLYLKYNNKSSVLTLKIKDLAITLPCLGFEARPTTY